MTQTYEYAMLLRTDQALAELEKVSRHFDKLTQEGNRAFKGVEKQAQLSGVEIGAVAGIVGGLVTQFAQLAVQGVQALVRVGAQSAALAGNFEAAKRSFTNIFQGQEDTALAVLDNIRDRAAQLGIELQDAIGLGRAFLPDLQNMEQFNRLLVSIRGMAEIDPVQGVQGARLAIEEAMSGQMRSLRERFEFTPEQLARVKQVQKEFGAVAGTIEGISRELERQGVNVEALGDTIQTKMGQAQATIDELRLALGKPLMETAMQGLDEFGAVMAEKGQEFQLVASVIGDTMANVVDFIMGGAVDFLDSLDTEQVMHIAQGIQQIVENVRTLAEVLLGVNFGETFLNDVQFVVDKLTEATRTAVQIGALAKAQYAYEQTRHTKAKEMGFFSADTAFITGTTADKEAIEAAGQAAWNQTLMDSVKEMEESAKRTEESNRTLAERRAELEKLKDTTDEMTEANRQMEERFAGNTSGPDKETAKAIEQVNEATERIEVDHQRRMQDIEADGLRARLDAEERFAQQREDLARQNVQEIEDIERDHERDIAEAGRDLNRDEQKILRDHARKKIEADKDAAKERLKVEEDYRQTLADIRRQYDYDLEEAERNQDAIAYLNLLRRRDRDISEAGIERDRTVEESRQAAEEKRAALQDTLAQELEDARINNRQKLEDLRLRLDQELEDQRIANERDLEEQRITEERRREELNNQGILRQQEEEQRWQRAYEDMNMRLAKELELVAQYEAKKTQVMVEAEEERQKKLTQLQKGGMATLGQTQYNAQQTSNSNQAGGQQNQNNMATIGATQHKYTPAAQIAAQIAATFGRAKGGPVWAGVPALVGENGPEWIYPTVPGMVDPLLAGGQADRWRHSPSFAGRGGGNVTTNSGNTAVVNVDPGLLSDEQARQVRQIVNAALAEVLGRR